ncbi:MAG: hypothetical protein JNK72_12155 [Myxococcales bacterium]|nr:hypothetical protein [Myxococcales bacterium]
MEQLIPILVAVGALAVLVFGILAVLARFYRQVDQGKALIVNTLKSEPVVTFTGAVVYPIIHRAEVMDISVKTIDIDRRGKDGLICKDNIRADIKVTFFVRVNKTQEDVLKVAQSIGCDRASDAATIERLFEAKFAEALKTVGKRLNFEDLYKERDHFKDAIIEVIGKDLNGFVMDDCAIDYLEQTPVESLDQNNIMDSEGIRKITSLTVTQNLQTNELRQKERMEKGSQNLAGDEAIFRFEQKRAEAEARKQKEIAIARAREENDAARIANEEQKRTVLAQEKNAEETMVAQQARERAVLVAMKNKEREVAVEAERVERARQLEASNRESDVLAQKIARDAEIERQRREIADVVRSRIVVDKTVAEEEERIKDVRALAESNRQREAIRIAAEADALQHLVKQVKAAEAAEEVAKSQARQRIISADADLESADKLARAKVRAAEGVQAETAAKGLAEVRVKEAAAAAIEKQGLVEAKVQLEKMRAEAAGLEQQGVARAKVREAEAHALEQTGLAEASSVRAKMSAEATGLAEKADAMKALDAVSRQHEEFRLQLEQQRVIALETIRAKKDVAGVQAEVLAAAFEKAKINIVGGDGQFFQRFMQAVTLGQSIDGAVDQSEVLKSLAGQLANLPSKSTDDPSTKG